MHNLNAALDALRSVPPSFPDDTKLTKIADDAALRLQLHLGSGGDSAPGGPGPPGAVPASASCRHSAHPASPGSLSPASDAESWASGAAASPSRRCRFATL